MDGSTKVGGYHPQAPSSPAAGEIGRLYARRQQTRARLAASDIAIRTAEFVLADALARLGDARSLSGKGARAGGML